MVEYKGVEEIEMVEIQMEKPKCGLIGRKRPILLSPLWIVFRSYCHGLPSEIHGQAKGAGENLLIKGTKKTRQVRERALSFIEVPDSLSRSMDLHPEL